MREITFHQDLDPLSAPEAQAIFHDLADNGRIAFNYAELGCDYRAYQMRAALQKHGLDAQLAWAVEYPAPLSYRSPEGSTYKWWFHVAVALPVVTERGMAEICVFDPGIFDGPVRLEDWAQKLQAGKRHFGIRRFDDENESGLPDAAIAVKQKMARLDQDTVYERVNEIFRLNRSKCDRTRLVYPSHVREEAERQSGYPYMRQGKNWQSTAAVPLQMTAPPPAAPRPRGLR